MRGEWLVLAAGILIVVFRRPFVRESREWRNQFREIEHGDEGDEAAEVFAAFVGTCMVLLAAATLLGLIGSGPR